MGVIPGGLILPHLFSNASQPSIFSTNLSGVGNKIGCVFRIPKTGNITNIYISNVNVAGESGVLSVGLYRVDSSGNPTTTAYGGMVAGNYFIDKAGECWVPLSTPASAVAGDIVAIICTILSVSVNLRINMGFASSNQAFVFPYVVVYAGSWTKYGYWPCSGIKYDDGTYPFIGGITAQTIARDTISLSSLVNEVGMKITLPVGIKINGIIYFGDMRNSYRMTLYDSDGATILASVVRPANFAGNVANSAVIESFGSEITLLKNHDYFITLAPMTSSSIYVDYDVMYYAETPQNRIMGANWYKVSRKNYGGWVYYALRRHYLNFLATYIEDSAGPGGVSTLSAAYLC